MNEGLLKDLERLREQSFSLKKKFSKTEEREWGASTVASELVLQTSHLLFSLMSPEERKTVYPTEGVDKGVEDELSDVLFNVLNTLSFLDLTVADLSDQLTILEEDKKNRNMVPSTKSLVIQSNNLWDNIVRFEGYKHIDGSRDGTLELIKIGAAGIIHISFYLAEEHNVDLMNAMEDMFVDASTFLNNYKREQTNI